MSDFKFECPHCQQSLEADKDLLGQVIECPACRGDIHLSDSDSSSQKTTGTNAHSDLEQLRNAGDTRVVDLGGGVALDMAWIPPGEFIMGSPDDEEGRVEDEGPQHRVTISKGYWMGKHEVTQAQYQRLMGQNPSHCKNAGAKAPGENVTWHEAKEFCGKLNGILEAGNLKLGTARLPTDAEWEYACRAGTTTAFHYGNDLDAGMANFNGNHPYGSGRKGEYRQSTVPVGSFRPNAWGLHDMLGNVWEWCEDGMRSYAAKDETDPVGSQDSGSSRVLRGGSWILSARGCRSALRFDLGPGYRSRDIGFRVVAR